MKHIVEHTSKLSANCRFLVGRNLGGDWVVCDRKKQVGGIFANQDSAIHFAESETNHEPGSVWCAGEDACLLADPWEDLNNKAGAG